ncbi:hypothetical protein PP301_gp075 [Gordonia phage GMA2]|uniref:DUF732 domain-containing protein n=1 Tax=Gordonia phage GMA2 TaxID=1647283 RepID=A0A0K0N7C5_9CAUD|nr:hypothetical protein PP301_gp075 [Gordonia phage GMA2]AKJ72647.1 hypothetical protein GMA2_109 [Gordonia phage GMA2]
MNSKHSKRIKKATVGVAIIAGATFGAACSSEDAGTGLGNVTETASVVTKTVTSSAETETTAENADAIQQYLNKVRSGESGVKDDVLVEVGRQTCQDLKDGKKQTKTMLLDNEEDERVRDMTIQQRINVGAYSVQYFCPDQMGAYTE